jgi:folate-binding protein YgfZ
MEGFDPWSWRPPHAARIEQPVALLRLEGPDTLRFLHGQSSQDLQAAAPGRWLSTCCLTPTARLRALAEVLVDGSGAWLVITAGAAEAVHAALDRVLFPADDVRLGQPRPGCLLLAVDAAAAPATSLLAPAGACWRPWEGGEGWWLGEALLLADGERPPGALPEPLAGREPLPAWAVELLRLRDGAPAAPAELNDDVNPFELGLAPRVSLAKGCYVGQETLARLATYDGVRQQLRRWCLAAPQDPAAEADAAAVLAPGATLRGADGERAGTLTSLLRLGTGEGFGSGGWVGLALVRRPALAAGTLQVASQALTISVPAGFVAPPVGAGGAQAGGGVSS